MRAAAAFLFTLATAAAAAGQPPPPASAPTTSPSNGAAAAYRFDLIRTQARFEDDGKARRELTIVVRVLDEAAVRQFGELPLPYEAGTEVLDIKSVQVQKPDGSIVTAAAGDVRDVTPTGQQGDPVFTDVRAKVVSVSALRPGDTLKVDAVWTTTNPVSPRQFWFEYSFAKTQIVQDEELEIDVPANRTIALRMAPSAPPEDRGGSGVVENDRRLYHWKTSHAAGAADPKPTAPGEDLPPADVRLSSFTSWNEVAAWYGGIAAASPDAAVRAQAEALTANAHDDAAKIAAIYTFVSTQIRYVSLDFGVGRFAAHRPADVLKNQYGDCKDKALLLVSLLDAVGIKAIPVLLNSKRSIADDFASPVEFDHMVALIPGAGDLARGTWMDSTIEVAPLGMLIRPTRDKRALAIEQAKAVMVRTPADPPYDSFEHVDVTGTVNPLGVLTGRVVVTMRGDEELALRAAVRATPSSALKDLVAQVAATFAVDQTPTNVETSDPADTSAPFRVSYEFRKQGYLDWAAKESKISSLVNVGVDYAAEADRTNLDSFPTGGPDHVRTTESFDFPSGYRMDPPAAVSLARLGFTYRSTYRVDDRRLTIEHDADFPRGRITAAQFNEYAAFASGVRDETTRAVAIHGDVSGLPDIPADSTSPELYGAAYSAYTANRFDAAAALWKRDTELDPKHFDAWDSLGLAYQKLHKDDDAVAALQKAIAIDAFNKRVYGDLAGVLKDQGKRDEAVKAYTKHLELNPVDPDALRDLGYLYAEMEDYADAAPTLEKAAGVLKPDAWLFAVLGTAYIRTHQADKAVRTFERALEVGKSTDVLTRIAWEFARAGIELDRADALARQSAKELGQRLSSLSLDSISNSQISQVENLAWNWDTIGWVAFQKGRASEAEPYVRAAWLILGNYQIAFQLGQICEKRDHLADALSYYLTADAVADHPTPDMMAHTTHLSGGGDLKLMLASAKRLAPSDRVINVTQKAPPGTAAFLAIVGSDKKAVDVKFVNGSDTLRPLIEAFKQATYPIIVPDDPSTRLVLGIVARCDESVCRAIVEYPNRIRLPQ